MRKEKALLSKTIFVEHGALLATSRTMYGYCKALFILSALWLIAFGAAAQPSISPEIEKLINKNGAEDAFWSITVRDTTGRIVEAYNPNKLVHPASNLKLLTAAAVLDELGSTYTYKTHMYGIGSQQDSTWNGNIVFRGAGDPSMSGTFYNDDRLHVMEEFYRQLTARGIEEINGNLIGNDSYFDSKPYPDGWSWDDLSFYYAVPINALSFNNNTVDLTVYASGNIGDTPTLEWFPFDTDYVEFVNDQVITPSNALYDEYYKRLPGTNTIILRSTLPKGYVEKEALSISNPPLYFLDTFRKYIENGGITTNGHYMIDSHEHKWSTTRHTLFGTHESPPLSKLLKHLNIESDNFYAEMLLKTAAAEHYNTQGTTELGVRFLNVFASSIGINTKDISISDGSGMSATNLITTNSLSSLLEKMRGHRNFDVFKNSLSIAGLDGSLMHRFGGTRLIGKVRAKTGYVSGVRALSGYLETKSNKSLIFSIVTNHYTSNTSYIDSIHESILSNLFDRY